MMESRHGRPERGGAAQPSEDTTTENISLLGWAVYLDLLCYILIIAMHHPARHVPCRDAIAIVCRRNPPYFPTSKASMHIPQKPTPSRCQPTSRVISSRRI